MASWEVVALVEATAFSGPALIGTTMSDMRAMVEVSTLTIEAMRQLAFWPISRASRVSAVSPD